VLDEELGIRPSHELQRLQQAILAQDPGLDPPPAEPRLDEPRLDEPRLDEPPIVPPIAVVGPSANWRRLLPSAAIAGAILVASIVALQLWSGRGDRLGGRLPADSGGPSAATSRPIDPQVLAELSVALPAGFGFGFESVWVAGHHDRTLRRIDPETNLVIDVIEDLGFQSNAVLASAGSVWVSSADGLYRVDPVTRQFTTIPGGGGGLASGFLNVWETTLDDRLIRIDLETNEVLETVSLGSGSVDWANELAIGFGSVWVAISDENKLVRVDPGTNTIIKTIEGFGDTYSGMPMAIGEGAVWIQKGTDAGGTLFRVDPMTNSIVARIPVGLPGGRVAVGGGWVWCGNAPGTLTKVDPDSDLVVATYRLDGNPQDVDFGFGSIWVDAYDASLVWRIAAD
jgi:streptogramin lyase